MVRQQFVVTIVLVVGVAAWASQIQLAAFGAPTATQQVPYVVKRVIKSDGTPEIHYSDGCVRTVLGDSQILKCGNTTESGLRITAVWPLTSVGTNEAWLKRINSRLWGSMKNLLAKDEASQENYRKVERGRSLVKQIEGRANMIGFLTQPRYIR